MSDIVLHPRTFPSNLINYIWNSGSACIAIASLTYSIAASLVRPLSPGIGVFEIVSVRSALSLLFSHVAYSLSKQTSPLFGERTHMPFLAMRGLIGALAMDCYYATIQRLPLADAVSLLFLNPVLTAVLAWLILKEHLTWKALGGSLVSLAGMLFVVRPPFLFSSGAGVGGVGGVGGGGEISDVAGSINSTEWSPRRLWGVTFGFASAFFAAGAYLTIRVIGKKASAISIAVWFHTAALTHASILLLFGWPVPAVWPNGVDWVCLVAIAVSSFSANILLNRGFQIETAAVGSAVNTSQVIYSHIIGIVVLHEAFSWIGALGAGMITVGVCIVALESKNSKTAVVAGAAVDFESKEGEMRLPALIDGTEMALTVGERKVGDVVDENISERSKLLQLDGNRGGKR
jgi:drug/metabolite transporter (DMT)-like permease